MRSSTVLNFAQTARILSQRRLVRVQLKKDITALGRAGSIVLVQPGRMRNELLPTNKAIYQPLPTPFQLSNQKLKASLVESQLESTQAPLAVQQAPDSLTKELGPIQLLSLRRKLQVAPPVVFARQTTTKFRPSSTSAVASATSADVELPKPALGIQGSIASADIVEFLRENGAFDLETDYSQQAKQVQLNRLTAAQINTACEFTLVSAQGSGSDSIDKLGRIKKTGSYELVAHILPSNIRVRIPVIVKPNAASTSASSSASASLPSSAGAATMLTPTTGAAAGQTRGYATSTFSKPTSMETSMRTKLESQFGPQVQVNIRNDSSKHAHHAAMAAQGGGNGETHFYVHVISDKFQGMTQIKRHRAVNALLEAEFERGLHALSLRTKTWAEEGIEKPTATATTQQQQDGQQESSNVDDPTTCPQDHHHHDEPASTASGPTPSLWTAPQSHLHPTSPLASTPHPSSTTAQEANDILSAFYTRPPSTLTVPSPSAAARVTPSQREKFFRRATKNDQLEPSPRQNLLNVLGGILATVCGTYMVLFADFGMPQGAENCFNELRRVVWGPEGPPKLFG